ncbi:YiiX/YebB-like N1pC/P60 family cysteine hydrolase [Amphritea sp. 1_MG-2023]|uniref:YiiX/YebB-like N1pC/P60 family cysteine hydrolase n=1 Tax=Amphritea sp. 1_MG-2023 TaxID=3062670 RepID=UPI0026E216A5|nr:YiiX/YebB-like N1pC/P60 family cysteine hydrolase [Amphritea sp. 1_MG-2023]MDO6563113.1 YiiX/YebB-like N1pC/P60 family cysteine hydrolase [Amphritea sp. 1_MG-2023]
MKQTTTNALEQKLIATLQEGDILFISIDAFLYKQVAKGTGSWSSHVGFAIQENNQWFVIESKVPVVRKTPLRQFLQRTCHGEVMVRRLKQPLSSKEIERLKASASKLANKLSNRLYHLGFDFESERQFCSKFVHLVYKDALNIGLGKVQTLEQLLQENPQASVRFWRCWFLGFIPWQRKTLTPASQINDEQLRTIFTTVSPLSASMA